MHTGNVTEASNIRARFQVWWKFLIASK